MKLLAAGLNAHGQFAKSSGGTTTTQDFTVIRDDVQDVLLSTWSTLVVTTPDKVISSGHQEWSQQLADGANRGFHSAVGDHNGLVAALDDEGQLHVSSDKGLKHLLSATDGPSLSKLAMAGNGRVAVIHTQAANGSLAHVGEFASWTAFREWYQQPSLPEHYPSAHHMVPGRPKQLVAGAGTFSLLLEDGNVFTWGDPRHHSLARSTVGDDAVPADRPGLVDALGGLKVEKIAMGGWLGAALAEGALYLWGSSMPGKEEFMKALNEVSRDEFMTLVDIGEPDVADVAIGDGHAVVARTDGSVFVVGENTHGQIGPRHGDISFVQDWRQVDGQNAVKRVVCGSKSTLLLVDD